MERYLEHYLSDDQRFGPVHQQLGGQPVTMDGLDHSL
jgi:hypothetical protein